MLALLFEHKKTGYPTITFVLMSAGLLVSIPTLLDPELYDVFGGYKPLNFPWQPFTIAFEHGFHGLPLPIHLGGNMLLFWICGTISEKLLGGMRYLLLSFTAIITYALAHSLPFIDGHGSSGLIWAYSPIVFMALRAYLKYDPGTARNDPVFQRARAALIIMWGVITVIMAVIPYAAGWRGNPLSALVLGNTFHITAMLTGFAFALLWKEDIKRRLQGLATLKRLEPLNWDRAATALSFAVPAFLLIILTLALLKRIQP